MHSMGCLSYFTHGVSKRNSTAGLSPPASNQTTCSSHKIFQNIYSPSHWSKTTQKWNLNQAIFCFVLPQLNASRAWEERSRSRRRLRGSASSRRLRHFANASKTPVQTQPVLFRKDARALPHNTEKKANREVVHFIADFLRDGDRRKQAIFLAFPPMTHTSPIF